MRAPKTRLLAAALAAVLPLAAPAAAATAPGTAVHSSAKPKTGASGTQKPVPSAPPPVGTYTTKGAWTFVSAPNLHPPKLKSRVKAPAGQLAPGYFLLTNFRSISSPLPFTGQSGPLIVDSHLRPVWFVPGPMNAYTVNLTAQTYLGKPVLAYWQGLLTNAGMFQSGTDYIVDQHYRTIAKVQGTGGWVITFHEMIIQDGDLWVTANKTVRVPRGSVPGCNACTTVVDSAIQEYDIKTGRMVYIWRALKHIPLSEVQTPADPLTPLDAYHVNSIQLLPGGRKGELLASMRGTWGVYLVDIATKKVKWSLLGSGASLSNFTLPADGQFEWQHDAELHDGGLLTLFDDACCAIFGNGKFGRPAGPSRGLTLQLDFTNNTATVVQQYRHPPLQTGDLETGTQGNTQLLPNGNVAIGWGAQPYFSEFDSSGNLLFDASFPAPDSSYRAYVSDWVGLPPASLLHAVAIAKDGKATIAVSWNGATEVVSWQVLGGPDTAHLSALETARKSGFETAIHLAKRRLFEVEALDAQGNVLATSKPFSPTGSSGHTGPGGPGTGPGGY